MILTKETEGVLLSFSGTNLLKDPPSLEDIATSLGRLARYNGHSRVFWSVLAHSMCVGDILPDNLRIHGLLHDAAESVIGDIPTPIKQGSYKEYELERLKDIYNSLGITFPTREELHVVKYADTEIFCAEAYTICHESMKDFAWEPQNESIQRVKHYLSTYSFEDTLCSGGLLIQHFIKKVKSLI